MLSLYEALKEFPLAEFLLNVRNGESILSSMERYIRHTDPLPDMYFGSMLVLMYISFLLIVTLVTTRLINPNNISFKQSSDNFRDQFKMPLNLGAPLPLIRNKKVG
ncbi:MAG: hypothetical protein IH946_03095 [Bacteroidetes bacterium]|nr:hypothetical protein [Bacteroidota bacterium]